MDDGLYDLLLTLMRDHPGTTREEFSDSVCSYATWFEEFIEGNFKLVFRLARLRISGDLNEQAVGSFLSQAEHAGHVASREKTAGNVTFAITPPGQDYLRGRPKLA